ncbi:MAG: hypothetical protein ABFD24_01955 [Anaerolineaceae bacterium]
MKSISNNQTDLNQIEPAVSPAWLLIMFLASVGGAVVAIIVLPRWVPGMTASIVGEQPKVFWYLSRASAFIAYILLWLSMILGVGITNKAAALWPGLPSAIDLHQFFSILGLFFALFHGLILMGDAYLKPTLVQVLTPFAMVNYRPIGVGVGQMAFFLWIVITGSFYVRKVITKTGWRAIHFVSYLVFTIALLHGLSAGSDSGFNWARYTYWITSVLLLGMTVYRIVNARLKSLEKGQIQRRPGI